MFNIVIFGLDNSGKTTLANSLAELVEREGNKCKYVHSLGNVSLDQQLEFLNHELLEDTEYDYKIFDRLPPIEEKVYGVILRGVNRYGNLGFERVWLSKIDLFVFCNPGFDTITNWGTREQMDGVIDNSKTLYNRYLEVYNELVNSGYNVKTYNFKMDDYKELIK